MASGWSWPTKITRYFFAIRARRTCPSPWPRRGSQPRPGSGSGLLRFFPSSLCSSRERRALARCPRLLGRGKVVAETDRAGPGGPHVRVPPPAREQLDAELEVAVAREPHAVLHPAPGRHVVDRLVAELRETLPGGAGPLGHAPP